MDSRFRGNDEKEIFIRAIRSCNSCNSCSKSLFLWLRLCRSVFIRVHPWFPGLVSLRLIRVLSNLLFLLLKSVESVESVVPTLLSLCVSFVSIRYIRAPIPIEKTRKDASLASLASPIPKKANHTASTTYFHSITCVFPFARVCDPFRLFFSSRRCVTMRHLRHALIRHVTRRGGLPLLFRSKIKNRPFGPLSYIRVTRKTPLTRHRVTRRKNEGKRGSIGEYRRSLKLCK